MNLLTLKLKEVTLSIIPIIIIVLILNFTITPFNINLLFLFFLGTFLILIGLTLFLIGIDLGITPLGNYFSSILAKSKNLFFVIIGGFTIGFFISIAEPSLLVFANQVNIISLGLISTSKIIFSVSLGLALMLAFGFVRIILNLPLYIILIVSYIFVFLLSLWAPKEFIIISFDASGATTGILAVPFILALAKGISTLKKDTKGSEEDSFGLVAIASVGAIIPLLILGIFSDTKEIFNTVQLNLSFDNSIISLLLTIPVTLKEVFFSILPLILVFIFIILFTKEVNKKITLKIAKGFLYSFLGLFLFLTGVNSGFLELGTIIGFKLVALNPFFLLFIGFILGIATILAEPAVHVLTHQVEDVTSGYIPRKAVLIALALGIGIAVSISMLRIIIPRLELWHILLPGYLICLGMTFFVPKLFVGIAFDAGGVATGPMIATFILALTQGAAEAIESANIIIDGLGMIATVAMIPIFTLQLLGLVFNIKSKKTFIKKEWNNE